MNSPDLVRTASASWDGDLPTGHGTMRTGSGSFEGPFSFKTRMGNDPGTNPEELIGAAHAGCFSMAFTFALSQAGAQPKHVETQATVYFGRTAGGFAISEINLDTRAQVENIDEATFQRIADEAKANCPVSKALAGVKITLKATLRDA
jgi:osmotically inducible protein OsmC